MSEATNKVTALRAELAKAEKAEKAEKAAARAAEKAARQAKLDDETAAFREDEYSASAGPHASYVGLITSYNGSIEFTLNEYTSFSGSAVLTREEALALAEAIIQQVK